MTNKVLLDTNSYLRLARIFHPLLGEQPGKSQTRMCILAETIEELKNSPRLQSKFKWYNKPEFTENRKYTLSIPKKHRKNIEEIEEHLWEHKKDMGYNTSIADVYMLACGSILDITVITDDTDMISLAIEFDIKVHKTIELLHFFVGDNVLEKEQIMEFIKEWIIFDDLPKNLVNDYKELFGENINIDDFT